MNRKCIIPNVNLDLSQNKGQALVWGLDFAEGVYGNMRGEGAWSASVAILLKMYGYEVTFCPSSFSGKPRPLSSEYINNQFGITYIDREENLGTYDLYFEHDLSFEHDPNRWEKFGHKMKKALFGTWWPSSDVVSNLNVPSNGQIVTPFFSPETSIKTIPRVFVDNFGSPCFDNKTVMWTVRSPFNTHKDSSFYRINLYHLRSTLKAVERGYRAIIMCAGPGPHSFYYDVPTGTDENRRMLKEVKSIVNSLKKFDHKVKFLNYMPRDKFMKNLFDGSVIVTGDGAGAAPTCVSYGLAPMLFYSWNDFFVSSKLLSKYGLGGDYRKVTENEVESKMFNLLSDKDYYDNYVFDLQNNSSVYTTEESLRLLQSAVQ